MLARTSCNCPLCQVGCQTMPGFLVPDDLPHFDLRDLCVSREGTQVIDRGQFRQFSTIVPQQRDDGACVFYEQGRCTVHAHSPFGCRMFDACGPKNQKFASIYGLTLLMAGHASGPYADALASLTADEKFAKPKAERMAAYQMLSDRVERTTLRKARKKALKARRGRHK